MEPDVATLSRVLAATERRAAILEEENEALRQEINDMDPSGTSANRFPLPKMVTSSEDGEDEPESGTPMLENIRTLESERIADDGVSAEKRISQRANVSKAAAAKANEKEMISLQAGDLVWLRQKDETQRGTVLGDCSLKTVGVQPDDAGSIEYVPPLRFGDGVFRLCSRFNYRSKVEVSKINKAIRQSNDRDATRRQLNLPLATKRMASEAVQNAELLERLVRSSPNDPSEPIRYGDVVQLQHVNSGLFLAMHKTPAPLNPTCRKVSLKAGSLAAHFKILPKYKVRSIGSLVYSDDEIVFQSVKHEGLYLGASEPYDQQDGANATRKRGSSHGAVQANRALKLRLPSILRRETTAEVNGAMELRSFTIRIYRRTETQGSLLTSLHWFRLFHPEANGFIQSSANPDKGQILDALGTDKDPLEGFRVGKVPAHLPYLKPLVSSADASNPINLSAKAVWSFEPLDRTTCVAVKWRTMPLRIRHVPSGKYLSVDSSKSSPVTPHTLLPVGGASGEDDEGVETFFDAALVDDANPDAEEGAFGSPSSLVFHLMPTDVTGTTLREGTSAIRVEHRSKGSVGDHRTLYLKVLKECKPPMLTDTGGSGIVRESTTGSGKQKVFGGVASKQFGLRLCFTSEFSALHVLKVQPLLPAESFNLNKLLSYLPLFKKYSYAYHAGAASRGGGGAPIHLCVAVASQCLDLIDDLRKGVPPQRRHGTNMTEALKEANSLKPAAFSLLYGGEPEPRQQKVAFEVKILEALFEAVVAPYNFAQHALRDGRPFANFPGSVQPRAVQKFMYVAIQRAVFANLPAQDYFSLRRSRAWVRSISRPDMSVAVDTVMQVRLSGDHIDDKDIHNMTERSWELWRNIIVAQGEDALGATVTLGQLLKSSARIVKKLVNNELMQRFQNLLRRMGPEVRLMNLFASTCYVEKKPSRANQEMCVRRLWMNTVDRYAYGVTLHEVNIPEKYLPKLGHILQPDGSKSPWPRERAPNSAPKSYLGCEAGNRYKRVCVAWTGADEWVGDCGYLWYSPKSMGIGPVIETRHVEGVTHPIFLVPLEQLMWVIEPERLSEPCTGNIWIPFTRKKKALNRKQARMGVKESPGDLNEILRRKRFDRQVQLATYVIAQLELLTQMCKGRSYNCISWLEKSFSFGLLINLATNPHLPYKLIATVMDFMQALHVDRFPQFKNSGAPILPEKLWVYHEATHNNQAPRSSTPVIQKVDLAHNRAFPVFFLSPLCSAYGQPDPVLSHPDHFKFFLLRSHCNSIIKSFGKAGRIIHDSQNLNEYGMAAIIGQQNLLKFGFQSTHTKLVDLCVPNGALLDGRSDLRRIGEVFDPPTARYRDEGSLSQVVTKLKREVINTFFDIGDLRTNFRLKQILYNFKEKAGAWTKEGGGKPYSAKEYIMQSTPAAVDALYADFEAMFPGGSGDGAKLDLAVLTEKKDMDQALIDCMMYDDDNLMSAALRLLESNYGQRRQLRTALSEVTMLGHIRIPVYGDVHALRADLSELIYLNRTSTVWGVKSKIAGAFDDDKFGVVMHILDKVLTFMHTPYEQDRVLMGPRGDDSSYCGHFAETDLQGNSYETKTLWSLDVANKWGPLLRDKSSYISKKNQDILRSSNLQEVLLESVMMDPEIAWKGSICTDREKAESERRLTMVKRALLVCCTMFASKNPRNQEIMFKRLAKLEVLATPYELMDEGETDGNTGLDSRSRISRVELAKAYGGGNDPGDGVWPTTVTQLAQNAIITVLRGNAPLCARVSPTLVSLFSHIVNLDTDVSAAPVLDMLFILCKPEAAPSAEIQALVCSNLTAYQSGHGLHNIFKSLGTCLETCAQKATAMPDFTIYKEGGTDDSESPVTFLVTAKGLVSESAGKKKMDNPERLVRLLRVVCEGGNEAAAAQLKQSCGISIDAVCTAIVNHLECSRAQAVKDANMSALVARVDDSSTYDLTPQAVLHLMSAKKGVGKSLLGLFVELVFLLPLNIEQIMSPPLWQFLQLCAVPMMEQLGKVDEMSNSVMEVCTDIFDLLEHIFITVVRLGLYRAVTENLLREQIIADIAEDTQLVLDMKQKTPEILRHAYIDYCTELKLPALDKDNFIALTIRLMKAEHEKHTKEVAAAAALSSNPLKRLSTASAIRTLSPFEREELVDAFDDADVDGNGEVDMYEFVSKFSEVSVGRDVLGSDSKNKFLNARGHRLGMRTIECGERIIAIRKGNGLELAAPHFTRQDEYGMRHKWDKKKSSVKTNKKLFVRPSTAQSVVIKNKLAAPTSSTGKRHRGSMTELPLQAKFELFQSAVQNNPRVLGALQKRRFTMVSILEKGTPPPPPGSDRRLTVSTHELHPQVSMMRKLSHRVSVRGKNDRKSMKIAPILEGEPAKPVKKLAPEVQRMKDNVEDAAALKIQAVFRKNFSRNESYDHEEETEAGGYEETPFGDTLHTVGMHSSVMHAGDNDVAYEDNTMSGAVALSWEDVTLRFVRYVTDHFWSEGYDSDTCTLIFETWNAHLIKARTWALDEDGRKLPIADMPKASSIKLCIPYELNDFELTTFHWKQSELNRMGVTQLLAMVISSLGHDFSEGSLPDTAIELFNELLNGGNEHVQNTLYTHLISVDTEGQLIEHMAKRFEKAFEGLVEAKKNGRLGSDDDEKSADIADDCEHAITTTRFLQLLCEGHHLQFQNYLRCQPMYGGDVDLIKAVCNMLVFLCESTFVVSKFTYIELDLVAQLLNTLIEAMLGPCAGNQELIAKSDVIASLNLVIHANNTRDIELAKQNPRYMGIRGLSCVLLAACLEGREDHVTHNQLERRLETIMLDDFRNELEVDIWVILTEAKSEERLPRLDEVERMKVMQQFLVAVTTVLTELGKHGDSSPRVGAENKSGANPNEAAHNAPAKPGILEVAERRQKMAAAVAMLKGAKKEPLVGLVEIAWRGKVERTVFPLPFEIKYLSLKTKKAFLDEADLSTSEKRMKSLLKKSHRFSREMEIIYREAEQSKVYRILHKHLPLVKLANYGLVFALNLNLLLSPASLGAPAIALVEHIDGTHHLNSNERLSLFFTMITGVLCTIGYGLIITNLAVTELPLLIQELDDGIREDTEEAVAAINERLESAAAVSHTHGTVTGVTATALRRNGRNTPLLADEGGPPVKRHLKAWLPLTFGLLVTVLFSMLHAFNFDSNFGLYIPVILIAGVPLTFSGLRDYIGIRPANKRERAYAIVYDCLVRRAFLRNHIILALCCFLGYFVNVEYFTLELLDVVIISPVIADIIKSVTTPGTAMSLVFYLFCCTVLIFASFGLNHFNEALQAPTYDNETGEEGSIMCRSALTCFYLMFYHGLNEGGNIRETLIPNNPGDSYFPRIVFDSVFFVWVGIVLMNIITGLMVDTFSSIREEKQSREDILINDCYVCGTMRSTYEDFALSNAAPSYDVHLAKDHNLWTYLYYIAYLKKKDPTEDSGIESYVRSQLEYYSLEWIPTRTSFVLEAEGKTGGATHGGEVGGKIAFNSDDGQLAKNDAAMTKMDQIISELRSQKE